MMFLCTWNICKKYLHCCWYVLEEIIVTLCNTLPVLLTFLYLQKNYTDLLINCYGHTHVKTLFFVIIIVLICKVILYYYNVKSSDWYLYDFFYLVIVRSSILGWLKFSFNASTFILKKIINSYHVCFFFFYKND